MINIDGIKIYLGCFDNIEYVKYAKQEKVNELFDEFMNEIYELMNEYVIFR